MEFHSAFKGLIEEWETVKYRAVMCVEGGRLTGTETLSPNAQQ
jgi:hypothetical protein